MRDFPSAVVDTVAPVDPDLADDPYVVLSEAEREQAAAVARALCSTGGLVDAADWVHEARLAWEELPLAYRRAIRAFRRDSGPAGALILRGLSIGAESLPPTPIVAGSVQRGASIAAAMLLMSACGLGDPVAFRAEKSGALVQDVVPVPGQERFQGNAGSTELLMHNENAFHEHHPDFVLLLCLRADHEGAAGLRLASIRQAAPLLSAGTRATLAAPEFVTMPPPSFGTPAHAQPALPVLSGHLADPDLLVDFAATTGSNVASRAALAELHTALSEVSRVVRLEAGDLAIVDNRVCVHGRTEFQPRYDGADRWLQRTFVQADLRRSRQFRPDDGHVIEF